MAFVVKLQNGTGDGAGRARYLLKDPDKVLAVSGNIPSPSLITGDYRTLADDFNRILLARQGDYRTDHFVISFQHRFSEEELEEIIEIIEAEFQKEFGEDRPLLIVVHAEEFSGKTPEQILEERIGERTASSSPIPGTSFHIVLGRNTEGKGIRLGKREYLAFKRRVAEKLQPFANEREREVFQHFLEGKRERAYYKPGELRKPEKNEKVWAKKILKDVTSALEEGNVEKAVEILNQHNAEIETFELSPYNKKELKEPTPYLILPRLNGKGMFAVRLRKAERTLYEQYKTAFGRVKDESQRISERAGIYLEQNRGAESFEERTGKIYAELAKVGKIGKELGRIAEELAEELGISPRELKQLADKSRQPARKPENREWEEERIFRIVKEALEFARRAERRNRGFAEEAGRRNQKSAGERNQKSAGEAGRRNRRSAEEAVGLGGRLKGRSVRGDEPNQSPPNPRDARSESPLNLSGGDIPLFVGKVKTGEYVDRKKGEIPVYNLIITDNPKVLEKLGAVSVEKLTDFKRLKVYWEAEKCRGVVKLYLERESPSLSGKVREALSGAVWLEETIPPWAVAQVVEEIRPKGVKFARYFREKDSVVLEEELRRDFENYLEAENEQLREIALHLYWKKEKEEKEAELRRIINQHRSWELDL